MILAALGPWPRWRRRQNAAGVIVGFDGQPEGKQAIKDGKIYADPIQFPDKMGVRDCRCDRALFERAKTLPPQTLIPTKLYRKADAIERPGT